MNDKDLDLLLAEYRNTQPTSMQVQKWKRAVRQELNAVKPSKKQIWMRLVAASVVGFIVGAIVFGRNKTESAFQQLAKNEADDATIEYVYTKSN